MIPGLISAAHFLRKDVGLFIATRLSRYLEHQMRPLKWIASTQLAGWKLKEEMKGS